MNEESPMDEVTDLIASIEMHRKEIEKETGLEASRNYSLRRLQLAIQEQQEAAQQPGASPAPVATAAALANEIKRVGALTRSAGQRPPQGGGGRPQQQQPRNFRQDQQRKAPKSRGRRTMGHNSGR
ncbi:MAG: hypothetical protein EXR32_10505 [Betaproteobacteria bacterium]|nr:hypothetical protein [Betaproteobacteria bacterium]